MFGWENEDEKLKRHMAIPAQKKLELLREIHEFTLKYSSKKMIKVHWKMRER